ncbi:MAG: TonB-dependent receptor [Acidobacteria bacterium]|nr:TonB-dependent receptor [Acidobacteriota bacterium]
MSLRNRVISLLLVGLLAATGLTAQSQRSSVTGRILDASGALVAGAKIDITNNATNVKFEAVSNDVGYYQFLLLPYGSYTLRVSSAGFRQYTMTGISLVTATTASLDISLTVQSQAEEVTVEAAAPLLEAGTSSVGVALEQAIKDEIPLLVSGGKRNPVGLFQTNSTFAEQPLYGGHGTFGGGRASSNAILLDGQAPDTTSVNVGSGSLPSVESLGEFKILQNSIPAEYGRTGGVTATFATKSGTNAFHGAGYEYLRNDKLNARPWQAAAREIEKQNEYGIAVGGPVYIPKLYNGKNKTFFFNNLTAYKRRISAASGFLTLPTDPMRGGDFSEAGNLPIYDRLDARAVGGRVTFGQFPANRIPASRQSRVSKYFLDNVLPKPTGPGIINNFLGVAPSRVDNWDNTIKIDQYITASDRISGFYEHSNNTGFGGNVLGASFGSSGVTKLHRTRFDWTRNYGPTVVQQVLAGFTRNLGGGVANNANDDIGRKAGITGTLDPRCPTIEFNYTRFNAMRVCQVPESLRENWVPTIDYSLTWNRAKHTIKMGATYVKWIDDFRAASIGSVDSATGWYNFGGGRRRGGGINDHGFELNTSQTDFSGGATYADFFLGLPASAELGAPNIANHRESYFAMFVQDDWRVTRKLTLNIGLRWDLNVPYSEVQGRITTFDVNKPNPAAGGLPGALAFYGIGEGRIGRNRPGTIHYNNFGPRLGFAYQLNSKTVVRGFAGIVAQGVQTWAYQSHNVTGFTANGSPILPANPFAIYYRWDDSFPQAVLGKTPNLDPTFRNGQSLDHIQNPEDVGRSPQLYNWSLTVQRDLGKDTVVEVGYVANNMKNASGRLELNQLPTRFWNLGALLLRPITSPEVRAAGFSKPYATFPDGSPLFQALRPFPHMGNVTDRFTSGKSSTYHAMNLRVQKRFSSGLSFLVGYTTSKYITDSQWLPGAFGGAPRVTESPALDKGLYRFDVTHRAAISYTYELPVGKGKKFLGSAHPVVDAVIGGWQIAGLQHYQSGQPVSASNGSLNLGIPTLGSRADQVPHEQVPLRSNIACSDLEFGNPARNYVLNAGNPTQATRTGRPLAFRPAGDFRLGSAANVDPKSRQCAQLNENISITKSFRIKELVRLRIGAEAFNLLNRHSWQTPGFGQDINGQNYGEIQPVQPFGARAMQVKLRVEW